MVLLFGLSSEVGGAAPKPINVRVDDVLRLYQRFFRSLQLSQLLSVSPDWKLAIDGLLRSLFRWLLIGGSSAKIDTDLGGVMLLDVEVVLNEDLLGLLDIEVLDVDRLGVLLLLPFRESLEILLRCRIC